LAEEALWQVNLTLVHFLKKKLALVRRLSGSVVERSCYWKFGGKGSGSGGWTYPGDEVAARGEQGGGTHLLRWSPVRFNGVD
jgi:hypothetical protein